MESGPSKKKPRYLNVLFFFFTPGGRLVCKLFAGLHIGCDFRLKALLLLVSFFYRVFGAPLEMVIVRKQLPAILEV